MAAAARRDRLRRSDMGRPGITRRGAGKGFAFYDPDGTLIRDRAERARLLALAVPPAWRDVWICPDPRGHVQATGIDVAGRRQYRYHPRWRSRRDAEKFDKVLALGAALPALRSRVTRQLRTGKPTLETALAAAVRLFDAAALRVGNEEYAIDNGSYGVTTMLVRHVAVDGEQVLLSFPAKSGQHVDREVHDPDLAPVLKRMLARDADEPALAWQDDEGGWHGISSVEVNDYLREATGLEITAKDFRTWLGTVTAAVALARRADSADSVAARRRAVAAAVREVAETLGNTPTIARGSYVDPRVIDRFEQGETIEAATFSAAERSLSAFLEN